MHRVGEMRALRRKSCLCTVYKETKLIPGLFLVKGNTKALGRWDARASQRREVKKQGGEGPRRGNWKGH